jgi:hypothetical protein
MKPAQSIRHSRFAHPGAWFALALFAITAALNAHADTRCVHNTGELNTAFDDANNAAEGTTWDIRVRQGTYQLTHGLTFGPSGSKDNKTFYLTGSWTGSNGACSSQTAYVSTTLQGTVSLPGSPGTGYFFYGDNKRFDIERIRFQDFASFTMQDHECIWPVICPDTDAIVIDHVEFDNGESVSIDAEDADRVVFRNNLVTHMHPVNPDSGNFYDAPAGFLLNNEGSADIAFNTFANLTCETTLGGVVIEVHISDFDLHHNIFQTTGCAYGLYVDPAGESATPISNLYSSMGGNVDGTKFLGNGNVQNFNPQFGSTAIPGDYHLQVGSPAINAGQTLLGAVSKGLAPSPVDLDGTLRPLGTRYDIGAYESAVNDGAPPIITVTSTSDDPNDTGSLRHAINQANAQVGTPQRIDFAISGGCPKIILLDSPLPDVTDPLFINGYSQPNSKPASDDAGVASDATICVLIAPSQSGVSHVLQVPYSAPAATQLVVEGIGFGSGFAAFADAIVELRGGSNHIVAGNAFGGLLPTTAASLGTIPRAILLRGSATDARIGGPNNRDRNYIGNSIYNAIVVTDATTSGHVIENNYIGLSPNGQAVQANAADGISATGGTDVAILGNVIDANVRGILLSGSATTGFTVQRNKIGVNALGIGGAPQANDVGIEIGGSSGQHVIGYGPKDNVPTFSNDIRNNNTAGINLTQYAGAFTSIRGNRIEANGRNGTGLGIDLGALGALDNDDGDSDTGPDMSQNYPVIKSVLASNGVKRTLKAILNTNANQAVRVDFYRSPTCPKGPTGPNATTWVGGIDVNAGATGIATFTASVAQTDPPGYLTATATTTTGNTSELAPCVREDTVFADGFKGSGL